MQNRQKGLIMFGSGMKRVMRLIIIKIIEMSSGNTLINEMIVYKVKVL